MSRPVRFGVTLPQIKRTWQEARDAAVEFDRLGYDSLWVCDHLYGVPAPQLPILEAWTQLAAIAAVTDQAKLGTLVTPPFFRNPAVLAKQIATIEQIAPGRTIAGLGAGWFKPEFEQTGCDFPGTGDRLRALEEMVEVMKRMWTEEKATPGTKPEPEVKVVTTYNVVTHPLLKALAKKTTWETWELANLLEKCVKCTTVQVHTRALEVYRQQDSDTRKLFAHYAKALAAKQK